MNQAQICPVCNGTGEIPKYPYQISIETKECHGCGGKGWIVVPQNDDYRVHIGWPTGPLKTY